MSDEVKGGCFSWLGAKKVSTPSTGTKVMGDQAKRISQDIQRKKASSTEEDFNLRVQGFDDDDPEIQAAKIERQKRRSQDMEAKKKEEEEAFQRRLQRI